MEETGASQVLQDMPVNAGATRDMVQSLGWEDPLEEKMATYSSILAWENRMDRGAWWTTVHGVAKELDTIEHSHACMWRRC